MRLPIMTKRDCTEIRSLHVCAFIDMMRKMVNQKGNFIQASVPQDKIINNDGKILLDTYTKSKR